MAENAPAAIRLTFVDADPASPDPAARSEAAGAAVEALRAAGHTVAPAYTGEKGGTVFEVVRELALTVYENKELITALAVLAQPIVAHLIKQREERAATSEAPPSAPPAITVVIGQATTTIPLDRSLSDVELIAQLLAIEPQLPGPVTPATPIQITVQVPPTPPRRRR